MGRPIDSMTTLERVWLNQNGDTFQIRIDWSNDRHQAVYLKSLGPEDVMVGFQEAARVIGNEIRGKHLPID